ncbi:MAG: 3-isopropylmalate dehydrogenase [bacterium]
MPTEIAVLPGDGIGPEVVEQGLQLLEFIEREDPSVSLNFEEFLVGGASLDEYDTPLSEDVLTSAQEADAVILGAVGGPKWDDNPVEKRPEKALLRLRKDCGFFANLRPAKVYPSLLDSSPLKNNIAERTNFLIVRELTGGIYFSEPRGIEGEGENRRGFNTLSYSYEEVERITDVAVDASGKRDGRLTSVDKANVLESSRVWRETVEEVVGQDVDLNHLYVDNAAMQIISDPGQFDVIVTGNLFGDILSDAAAQLPGSIGLLPSASLGETSQGMYEPVHGSAPDIAGESKANPLATILSVAMLMRYTLDRNDWATKIEESVESVLQDGYRTPDIAGSNDSVCSTTEMGEAVLKELQSTPQPVTN